MAIVYPDGTTMAEDLIFLRGMGFKLTVQENIILMREDLSRVGFKLSDLQDLPLSDLCDLWIMSREGQ